jgi:4-hydroxybenzoate polyprenyltransferase/phosphoserine phosphatase
MVPLHSAPLQSTGILFVDLDRTLVATDLLWESVLLAVKRRPWLAFSMPLWLYHGRAALKHHLAEQVTPNPSELPYCQEVIDFLRGQKAQGRHIVLATASDEKWARAIAAELGVFDAVLASNGQTNLKGRAKLEAIRTYCGERGKVTFDYIGDSRPDLPIWRESEQAYLCGPSGRLVAAVERSGKVAHTIGRRPARIMAACRALRPQQWVKNLLLFVPLIVGHAMNDAGKVLDVFLAFLVFCATASAIYLINDLLDVGADRCHPVKRCRPFASGELPLTWGPPLALALLATAFTVTVLALPAMFTALLAGYVLLTNLYSFWLKRKVILDVLILAGLYTIRIQAGGVAAHVLLSEWLMAFSMFLFTSLAFVKRYAELVRLAREDGLDPTGRGYVMDDLAILESIGPSLGCVAVLVFALYINSEAANRFYANPLALWLICPLLLYGITRLWFLAKRGKLMEDPVLFACKDRTSLLVGIGVALVFAVASWVPMPI